MLHGVYMSFAICHVAILMLIPHTDAFKLDDMLCWDKIPNIIWYIWWPFGYLVPWFSISNIFYFFVEFWILIRYYSSKRHEWMYEAPQTHIIQHFYLLHPKCLKHPPMNSKPFFGIKQRKCSNLFLFSLCSGSFLFNCRYLLQDGRIIL